MKIKSVRELNRIMHGNSKSKSVNKSSSFKKSPKKRAQSYDYSDYYNSKKEESEFIKNLKNEIKRIKKGS